MMSAGGQEEAVRGDFKQDGPTKNVAPYLHTAASMVIIWRPAGSQGQCFQKESCAMRWLHQGPGNFLWIQGPAHGACRRGLWGRVTEHLMGRNRFKGICPSYPFHPYLKAPTLLSILVPFTHSCTHMIPLHFLLLFFRASGLSCSHKMSQYSLI